jgi:glycosyltransferase involved in cell wall biosynthesis
VKNKILILTPPLDLLHGVSLHYTGLRSDWKENVIYFETFKIKNKTLLNPILYGFNLLKFIFKLVFFKPDITVINVSLKKGFFSKNRYLTIIKYLSSSKKITFIHGWDVESENLLTENKGRYLLENSDSLIVLAKEFKTKLINCGYKNEIFITTTKVDKELLREFNKNRIRSQVKTFLFVSRIEKYKGIYEAVELFVELKKDNNNAILLIVGDGSELNNVKAYIDNNNYKDIFFFGRLSGNQLAQKYYESDLLLFPSYSEGVPAVILEAMSFGLIIATTPVGGIVDFFDENMGVFLDKDDHVSNVDHIKTIMKDEHQINYISNYNFNYSRTNFLSSKVAGNLEDFFNKH